MARGGRVKQNVVEPLRLISVGQKGRKFIECRDLDGAGAGKLLLHVADDGIGELPAIRPNNRFAVFCGRGKRVEVCNHKPRRFFNLRAFVVKRDAENILQVGCRVGADEQHLFPGIRKGDSCGAGNRSLAYAALAGKEQIFCH